MTHISPTQSHPAKATPSKTITDVASGDQADGSPFTDLLTLLGEAFGSTETTDAPTEPISTTLPVKGTAQGSLPLKRDEADNDHRRDVVHGLPLLPTGLPIVIDPLSPNALLVTGTSQRAAPTATPIVGGTLATTDAPNSRPVADVVGTLPRADVATDAPTTPAKAVSFAALANATPSPSADVTLPVSLLSMPSATQTTAAPPVAVTAQSSNTTPMVLTLPNQGQVTPPMIESTSATDGVSSTPASTVSATKVASFTNSLDAAARDRNTATSDSATVPTSAFVTGNAGQTVSTAPASAPGTASMPPVIQHAADQIVAQASLLQNGQSAEMRLRLRPPDLGDLQVTLRRETHGGLTVHLIPATREGSDALAANLHHLQSMLDAQSNGQGAQLSLTQYGSSGQGSAFSRGQDFASGDQGDIPETSPTMAATTRTTVTAGARLSSGATIDYTV